jgi:hypothetical protein
VTGFQFVAAIVAVILALLTLEAWVTLRAAR